MRWPWSGREAAEPSNPQEPSTAVSTAAATGRPHEEWRHSAAAPLVLGSPLVADSAGFVQRLVTRHVEQPILQPLSHDRSLSAPSGLAVGVVRNIASASSHGGMPPARRGRAVQRRRPQAPADAAWPTAAEIDAPLEETAEGSAELPEVVTAADLQSLDASTPPTPSQPSPRLQRSAVVPLAVSAATAPTLATRPPTTVAAPGVPDAPELPFLVTGSPVVPAAAAATFAVQRSRQLPVVSSPAARIAGASAELPLPRRLVESGVTPLETVVAQRGAAPAVSADGPATQPSRSVLSPGASEKLDVAPMVGSTPLTPTPSAPLMHEPFSAGAGARPRGLGEPMTALPRRLRGADAAAATASAHPFARRTTSSPDIQASESPGTRETLQAVVEPVVPHRAAEPVQRLTLPPKTGTLPVWQETPPQPVAVTNVPEPVNAPLVGAHPLRPTTAVLATPPGAESTRVTTGQHAEPAVEGAVVAGGSGSRSASAPLVVARSVAPPGLPAVATASNLPPGDAPAAVSRSLARPAASQRPGVPQVASAAGHPAPAEAGSPPTDIAAAAALFDTLHSEHNTPPLAKTLGALLGAGEEKGTPAAPRPTGVRRVIAGAPQVASVQRSPSRTADAAPGEVERAGVHSATPTAAPDVESTAFTPARSWPATLTAQRDVTAPIAPLRRAAPQPSLAVVHRAEHPVIQRDVQPTVQRDAAAPEAAAAPEPAVAAPATSAAPATPAVAPAELADQLYDHIAGRLRRDLLIERERSGLLLDR